MNALSSDEILSRYPKCLQDNIKEIWSSASGTFPSNIQVNLPPNKLEDDYEVNYGNSLILEIPYAGKFLQWEIIFNDEDLSFPPDFDILNDNFLADPNLDMIEEHLKTLTRWDIKNAKSLVMFIDELLAWYKKHQLEKLQSESKCFLLLEEYQQVKEELKLTDSDIELFIENNGQNFLIPLKLDYSKLPVYIQETYFQEDGVVMNPGTDWATLKICFHAHKTSTQLQLSPRLENVFGTYSSLHIPLYKKSNDMVDYVKSILKIVETKVQQINDNCKWKEKYMTVLLSLHGTNVVEYDNISFEKATYLFEMANFHCLVNISLSNRFPAEPPTVTIRSVYHKNSYGEPAFMVLKNYPYNQNWNTGEMVDKLLLHIRGDINRFKNHCISKFA